MTLSILTFNPKTGVFAGAAATGSLCVGGWVLRGDIESGLVASQGTAPSTFWRDDILRALYHDASAHSAIEAATQNDEGRDHRQIAALDKTGGTFAFTGTKSVSYAGQICVDNCVITGNMLSGPEVLEAMHMSANSPPNIAWENTEAQMLNILRAGINAGGDSRGIKSAALLVLRPDHPPVDLRIDYDEDALTALETLLTRAKTAPYYDWLSDVPVIADKSRQPTGS